MQDYKDIIFDVGIYRCVVDILGVQDYDVDFKVTECAERCNPQYSCYDYDFDAQQLHDDVRNFCIYNNLLEEKV